VMVDTVYAGQHNVHVGDTITNTVTGGLTDVLTGFAGRAFTASEIELIRSNPGKVPRYEQLGRWPLRAGQERSAPASRSST